MESVFLIHSAYEQIGRRIGRGDLTFMHLFFEKREITNSKLDSPLIGTYNGSAELIGFGINYDF